MLDLKCKKINHIDCKDSQCINEKVGKKCVFPSAKLFWTNYAHWYDLMNNNESAFCAAKMSSYCSDSITLSSVHINDNLS